VYFWQVNPEIKRKEKKTATTTTSTPKQTNDYYYQQIPLTQRLDMYTLLQVASCSNSIYSTRGITGAVKHVKGNELGDYALPGSTIRIQL
jgi:hypothetical protein